MDRYLQLGVYHFSPATGERVLHVPKMAEPEPEAPAAPAGWNDEDLWQARRAEGWSSNPCGVCDLIVNSIHPHSCCCIAACVCPCLFVSRNLRRADLGRRHAAIMALVACSFSSCWLGLGLAPIADGCEFLFPLRLLDRVLEGDSCGHEGVGLAIFCCSWLLFATALFWTRVSLERRFALPSSGPAYCCVCGLLCFGCYSCTLTQEERHVRWECEGREGAAPAPVRRDDLPGPGAAGDGPGAAGDGR